VPGFGNRNPSYVHTVHIYADPQIRGTPAVPSGIQMCGGGHLMMDVSGPCLTFHTGLISSLEIERPVGTAKRSY
jgi:hypothetical protein